MNEPFMMPVFDPAAFAFMAMLAFIFGLFFVEFRTFIGKALALVFAGGLLILIVRLVQ